jgi:hypothetical protein
MPDLNRQIVLKSRPEGVPGLDNFALTKAAIPEPGDGEVLMRTLYLSLDPYMRGRMSAVLCQAGRGRGADGGRHGRPDRRLAPSRICGQVTVQNNCRIAIAGLVWGPLSAQIRN